MVKLTRPGRVKTRLAKDIGNVPACWWMRHQTRHMLRHLRDPRWDLLLAVAPDTAVRGRDWPRGIQRLPQGPGDLGARMGRLLRTAPSGPVCIVGADIPGLTRAHVARGFAALGRAPAVFGPAEDGGYWMIGLRRTASVPATLFRDVRWSTAHALSDTIASLPDSAYEMTDRLRDVDTAGDLPRQR